MGPTFFYSGKRRETNEQIKSFALNHNFATVRYIGGNEHHTLVNNNIYNLEEVYIEGASTRYKLYDIKGLHSHLLFQGVTLSQLDGIRLFRLL